MTATKKNHIVQPYLNFDGRCDDALEFYKKTLGAQVDMLMRFKDCPETPASEGCSPQTAGDKVMHCSFRIGENTLMASDCQNTGKVGFQGFSLSLTVADVAESQRVFALFAEEGVVHMPLAKTFFSPSFGVVADRFGMNWMVYVSP